jgi:hypothetical protein
MKARDQRPSANPSNWTLGFDRDEPEETRFKNKYDPFSDARLKGESKESIEERRIDSARRGIHYAAEAYLNENGSLMNLADFECTHNRMSGDGTPACGCWPAENWLLDEQPDMQEDLMEGVKRLTRAQVIGLFNVAMSNGVIDEFKVEHAHQPRVTDDLGPLVFTDRTVRVTVASEFGQRSYVLPPEGGAVPAEPQV